MKRLTALLALVLAVIFLFNSCALFGKANDPADDSSKTDPAPDPGPSEDPTPAVDPIANAIRFSDLETSKTALRYGDFINGAQTGDTPIGALVILAQFTDGLEIDKTAFEEKFTKDWGPGNSMRSLSSYYKYSSYGKITFNFQFVYYDSGMTTEEAWHHVHDEDENGFFYGNQYIIDIFNEVKSENKEGIDYKSLDGDGDGYVDVAFFIGADDPSKLSSGSGYKTVVLGSASGTLPYNYAPDPESPTLSRYVKTDYESLMRDPAEGQGGSRTLIHETGHVLGLPDYYDAGGSGDTHVETLGFYDMMSADFMDHNPYSKFALGFVEPYVVQGIEDEITIRMSLGINHSDVILIPTSKGWNGTAFDEYILIDICAPVGANKFDWERVAGDFRLGELKNTHGGVRIYHVDARLKMSTYTMEDGWSPDFALEDLSQVPQTKNDHTKYVNTINSNSITYEPSIEGESKFYNLVEIVPSDRSNKFRLHSSPGDWNTIFMPFSTNDLYGVGDTFVLDEGSESFVNAPYMNNGGTLDYSVTVLSYNEKTNEAVITIKNIAAAR